MKSLEPVNVYDSNGNPVRIVREYKDHCYKLRPEKYEGGCVEDMRNFRFRIISFISRNFPDLYLPLLENSVLEEIRVSVRKVVEEKLPTEFVLPLYDDLVK